MLLMVYYDMSSDSCQIPLDAKKNALLFIDYCKEKDVKFFDFRFTDTLGKWHHTTKYFTEISEEDFTYGISFDGSSIQGWQPINESDMIFMPDVSTAFLDPFTQEDTVFINCDIHNPISKEKDRRYIKCSRSIAYKAEEYLKSSGIGDVAYAGPEPEFFIFDNVRFGSGYSSSSFDIDFDESPSNSNTDYDHGNTGHRPRVKGGYFPVSPVDSAYDMRCEMISKLADIGVNPSLHHHEVAPGQHELGFLFDSLVATGDNVQKYKYVVQQVADSYGKSATFMPKPIASDNGSGMHVHQSIFKNGENVFAGDVYEGLSQDALYYIGGILKHAPALCAFTNASTNSYKRLQPGFEAPVKLAYSARNRSAAIRIPFVPNGNAKARRIEMRFPDISGNPYLIFASMLMAGIDGVKNKIDPGKSFDGDLYDGSKESESVRAVPESLKEALQELKEDCDFLKKGNVFTDACIDAYIELKMKEVAQMDSSPHPVEFELYYSV